MSIGDGLDIYEIALGLGWVAAIVLALRPIYDRVMTWRLQARLNHHYLLDAARLEEEAEALSAALVRCLEEQARLRVKLQAGEAAEWRGSEVAALSEKINTVFSEAELERFCFLRLGIDLEDVSGENMQEKCLALVRHVQRRGRMGELIAALGEERGHVGWG